MTNIVERPLMTEKTLALASRGYYTFKVAKKATKPEIGKDIGKLYNVKVISVRTVSMRGKSRRVGRKMTVTQKSDWKKAVVKLAPGQKIEAFEVASEGEKK